VNREELEEFIPKLLEARYPGRVQKLDEAEAGLPGIGGWIMDLEGCVLTVRVSRSTHPFIWIRGGVAHGVPKSEALALRVAAANKDLVVGRIYMAYGDDLAMVVVDESIFGGYLSFQYEPSIEDTVHRLVTSVQYTVKWAEEISREFGGQPFTANDWHLLTF
jgi:hypothetical protein